MQIQDIRLEVNPGNPIPHYQQKHKLYDRFLPFLGKYIDGTVIDVGANCGLLMTSMLANNPNLSLVCIEAEENIFKYLARNYDHVRQVFPDNKVQLIKGKVGTVGIPLDTVIREYEVDDLSLIKIDTDGYDWDVIASCSFEKKPLIYYEADFRTPEQYYKFSKVPIQLLAQGYSQFYLFDNYGEFVTQTNDPEQMLHLMNYIWRMKQGHSDTTIWYFDILVATPEQEKLCNQIVTEYCASSFALPS